MNGLWWHGGSLIAADIAAELQPLFQLGPEDAIKAYSLPVAGITPQRRSASAKARVDPAEEPSGPGEPNSIVILHTRAPLREVSIVGPTPHPLRPIRERFVRVPVMLAELTVKAGNPGMASDDQTFTFPGVGAPDLLLLKWAAEGESSVALLREAG